MLTVSDMISRVRTICHDTQSIEYTDVFILNCINDAVRILRRTAMTVNPEVITVSFSGNTVKDSTVDDTDDSLVVYGLEQDEEGDWMPAEYAESITQTEYSNCIKFEHPVSKIVQVSIEGKTISGISVGAIHNATETGRPEYYYMAGFDKLMLYPSPDKAYAYNILYVDDISLLDIGGKSPFPTILDDLMVEYAGLRVSISNEFDTQQEQQLLATFVGQIENVLSGVVKQDIDVAGYWDIPKRRKAYGGI